MLDQLASAGIYIVYLMAPGLLFVRLMNWHRNTFLLAYGIGFTLLVLSQVPFRVFGGEIVNWLIIIHGIYMFMFVVGCIRILWLGKLKYVGRKTRTHSNLSTLIGAGAVIVGFTSYHLIVGPYTEIPSDFWARLGHVKEQLTVIESGQFEVIGNLRGLFDDTAYVPFLHAIVAAQLGILSLWLVGPVTLISSMLFLLATYWFTLKIFSSLRISTTRKVNIAFLTALLTLVVYGVASFSFVRYYAYFPHLLNSIMIIVTLALFIDYIDQQRHELCRLAIICIFSLVTALVNLQEALLLVVLLSILSIWKMIKLPWVRDHVDTLYTRKVMTVGITSVSMICIVLTAGFWFGSAGPWGKPHLLDLGIVLPFMQGWPIANPSMRFWDTLGLFGALVYAWYLLRWRWFKGMDYVNIAMFSPVLTIFNPVFVLWFLYVATWDPLWRLAFLMPVPTVAAYLVVMSWNNKEFSELCSSRAVDKIMVVLLAICLVPFQTAVIDNDNSRLPSLNRVDTQNGSVVWRDLVEYFDQLEGVQEFVTDNATNYVLHTATRHDGLDRPKERWQMGDNYFAGDYRDRLLYYRLDNKLLVINKRNGSLSITGKLSGHWPEDIMRVAETYPPDIIEFVESRPKDFSLIWESNKIRVYRILRNPEHYN